MGSHTEILELSRRCHIEVMERSRKGHGGKTWYIQEVRKDSEKDKINENMYIRKQN
jgi:hypothetical protein